MISGRDLFLHHTLKSHLIASRQACIELVRAPHLHSSSHRQQWVFEVATLSSTRVNTILALEHKSHVQAAWTKEQYVNWNVLNEMKLWHPHVVVFWNSEEQCMMGIDGDIEELDLRT